MENTSDPLRYLRQTILPELGIEGQRRLEAARVLIVGVGGLGSPAALYLAAAGVGTLGLVEFDIVDESNLHRQVLYTTPEVGRPKIEAAAERLRALNPHVAIEPHGEPLTAANALDLVRAHDLVVDGTDNFTTRYLVNDACVMEKRPNVYGSIFRFEGQMSVFATAGGPCYRCLHPEPPPAGLIPSCAEAGVLGVLPAVVGSIQATEAIKLITGMGQPLVGRLLLYDALRMRFREIAMPRDRDCPVCGDRPTITSLRAYDFSCELEAAAMDLTVEELHRWRQEGKPHVLVDVREPSEAAICAIEGAILVPLGQLGQQLHQLPTETPVVVHCRSGARSARAAAMLRAQGFDAHNLTGGILAWADRIDPKLVRY